MSAKPKQFGLTLPEMVVVIAIIAMLVGVGLPAVRMVQSSFESGSSARSMISAALASARALAAKENHYVGVRFQKAYNPDAAEPLNPLTAPQYMIFIIHDPERAPAGTGLANGFRAIEGAKPMKLPDSVGVMDLTLVNRSVSGTSISFTEDPLDADAEIDTLEELRETTTFSVIFSPSGKLLMHKVRVRNKNGRTPGASSQSLDDIFNTELQIAHPTDPYGMFFQDDYLTLGLGPEYSRRSFIIYSRLEFKQAYKAGKAWSGYLAGLEAIYINPYTGTIISTD